MTSAAAAEATASLKLDDENPWPGLASYDEASTRFFHGREADSAELVRLVRLSTLVMLYGKSGLGKSSMLQAGAFPALRAERFLPVYLRLDYAEGSRLPPLEQAQQRVLEESRIHGHDAAEFEPGEGLWSYLQRLERPIWTYDNFPVTPVLVFDQFEEVFSRSGSAAHLAEVLTTMGNLVAGRVPPELVDDRTAAKRLNLQAEQYHCVLSFRSDFLADVETWAKTANLPRRESLHLQALKREPAIDAVQRAGHAVLAPGMASRIVDFLLQKEGGAGTARTTDVEPVLLSLCCYQLNLNRQRKSLPKIDEALLQTVGEGILKGFYQDAMKGMDPRVARFVEENLIQGDRFRASFPRDGALGSADGLTQKELDQLTASRLLRVDPQGGEPRIELIHDRLVGVVREARDARRAVEREAAERADAEKKAAAQRDAQRLVSSEAERKRLAARQVVLVSALSLAVVGMSLAAVFGWAASQARDVAATETLVAKKNAKDLESTAEALGKEIELLKVEGAQVRLELAEAREKLAVAKPGGATLDVQQAKSQVSEARDALQKKEQIAAAAVAPAAPAAPTFAPPGAGPTKAGAEGPSALTIDDWRLSSGGCNAGAAAVTSVAVFTVVEQDSTVSVKADYTGKGSGYTVKGSAASNVPKASLGPFVDIETRHEWRRGAELAFTTTGVDRVFIANGRPTRANLMRIRTTCP